MSSQLDNGWLKETLREITKHIVLFDLPFSSQVNLFRYVCNNCSHNCYRYWTETVFGICNLFYFLMSFKVDIGQFAEFSEHTSFKTWYHPIRKLSSCVHVKIPQFNKWTTLLEFRKQTLNKGNWLKKITHVFFSKFIHSLRW